MVNAKKDKKLKKAKAAKKNRKKANRTAITLSNKDSSSPDDSENLWEKTLPALSTCAFDFTDGDKHLIDLWDRQPKEDQLALLAVNRSHLLSLLNESLHLSNYDENKFPKPPRKDVAMYQAVFLRSLSKTIRPPKDQPCQVQLHSLSSEELNGQYGIRGAYNNELLRWHIQLEISGKNLHVKDINFNVIDYPNQHRGITVLPSEPTILNVIVFEILKDRLQQLLIIEKSVTSIWILVFYLIIMYASNNIGFVIVVSLIYLFITFQNSIECNALRTRFISITQHTLCQDRSSIDHMSWKSNSYLAAFLLILMVRSSSTLFVVVYQIVVPYMMFSLEKCGTKDDQKCFNRMRVAFSWFNKLILLYYAFYVNYLSLLIVCMCMFPEISKIGFSILFFGIAWLMTNSRKLLSHFIPMVVVQNAALYKKQLFAIVTIMFSFLMYATWNVTSFWIIPLRIVLVLIMLCIFPEYSIVVAGYIVVGISKGGAFVQICINQIKQMVENVAKMKKKKDDNNYGFTEKEWKEMERSEEDEGTEEAAMDDID